MSPRRTTRDTLSERALAAHQRACRACRACVDDGALPAANPTFEGGLDARFMLVGQAPGPVERDARRPFWGRAGRELSRWMVRAGFRDDDEFRQLTYIASVIRCFPGRAPAGGDLRPPPRAIANCAHWLDAELALIHPLAVLAVGQLAIARFLGPSPLEARVGRAFGSDPMVVPLPHPSGQSRWLNQPENRRRLDSALEIVSSVRRKA
jgi:uracil-DNA glycosylase